MLSNFDAQTLKGGAAPCQCENIFVKCTLSALSLLEVVVQGRQLATSFLLGFYLVTLDDSLSINRIFRVYK